MLIRSLFPAMICLAVVAALAVPGAAVAQVGGAQKKQAPDGPPRPNYITVKGTVVEVNEKSGRVVSVDILGEGGGDPVTVPITPRIQFSVEGKGDDGFLREKVVVSGTGTLTNKLLFVKSWTVHLGVAARRLPSGVKKADKAIGQSVNAYFVQGPVKSRQQDKAYEDYETLTLTIPALRGQPVYIDKGASVTVRITDASAVEKGAPVELYQKPGRGGRLMTVGLKVLLEEPLKAEEYFAKQDEKKKKKR